MRSIRELLGSRFQEALGKVLGPEAADLDPLVAPTRDERFGDYQCNLAMSAAKKLGRKPREIAAELMAAVELEMCEPPEIAGPGFINLKLKADWLGQELSDFSPDRWGQEPRTVVVDYSSPNVAKELHVGHIRSTIIGDAISRILEFGGHRVIRQNHLGDWGTQFGILCAYLKEVETQGLELSSIEQLYRAAAARFKTDQAFADQARAEVVALHQGEPSTRRAWQQVIELSRKRFIPLYRRMGVLLRQEDERGESFYNDRLPGVVEHLKQNFSDEGRLRVVDSEGAVCVFLYDSEGQPRFLNPEGQPLPLLVQKSDGAFLYSTTDIAAIRFRVEELGADWIVYVVGAPQKLHFEMLFATVREAGYAPPEVKLEHVAFGSILGEDRKPFKTRDGGTVKLEELLDEAVERAAQLVRDREADPRTALGLSLEEIPEIAEVVGVGGIKYADLSQSRTTDYVFSWDKMLSLEGNTAPYLMYAYARTRSLLAKAGVFEPGPIRVEEEAELKLALALLRFPETLEAVQEGWRLNLLCDYLYGVAGLFSRLWETVQVLKAPEPQRLWRLRLCCCTGDVLKLGLGLLGIRVLQRM
ncbi:MAG: arginine--tRNA ligase [Armatimonadetes bacterium]|nr:arginine--tRNA ligase [Armatimonadota bacterium]